MYALRVQLADVDHLTCLCPLHKGLEAASRNNNALLLAGRRIDDKAVLKIWHLATLGLLVTVAHIVACEGLFAGNGANFGHRI